MKTQYKKNKIFFLRPAQRILVILSYLLINCLHGFSQCPANIDFENGTFDGWNCYIGEVAAINSQNVISLQLAPGPVADRHTMLSTLPGDGLDEYGGFPKNCPNGSGHSIRLGNNVAGGNAEGLSYQFTIPSNANRFTLTYNYAVVFEDPGHDSYRQPRLEITVEDLDDEVTIDCFSFAFIADNSLPGFLTSAIQPHESPVRYKPWTENTIYLNGYQGKTIRLFIKTADCTYAVHFGYAYIDVSSKCNNSLVGETYCIGDTAVNITAPSGYQHYNWYNANYSQLLGDQQQLHLQPPPPAGTPLHVELLPYPGYGCQDTLDVDLQDTLVAHANAGPDLVSCNFTPVQLGVLPVTGMLYSWTPDLALSNPSISNPVALPDTDTTYILNIHSVGGGCYSSDTVAVTVRNIDNNLELIGEQRHCLGNGPNAVLKVGQVASIQWYRNEVSIPGANQVTYTVTESGTYYALLVNSDCSSPLQTRKIDMVVDTARPGTTYPLIDIAYNFPIKLHARGVDFASSVLWSPATNLDNPNIYTPYFKGMHEQFYTIEIKTATGCTTVDTQMVKTHKEIAIYVPSVFTPGGDGVNDYLRPLLLGFEKVKYFRIYNRWGKMIYQTQSDLPGWDGRIGNVVQETQTVIWMIEAVDIDGKTHFRKGSTLLIH